MSANNSTRFMPRTKAAIGLENKSVHAADASVSTTVAADGSSITTVENADVGMTTTAVGYDSAKSNIMRNVAGKSRHVTDSYGNETASSHSGAAAVVESDGRSVVTIDRDGNSGATTVVESNGRISTFGEVLRQNFKGSEATNSTPEAHTEKYKNTGLYINPAIRQEFKKSEATNSTHEISNPNPYAGFEKPACPPGMPSSAYDQYCAMKEREYKQSIDEKRAEEIFNQLSKEGYDVSGVQSALAEKRDTMAQTAYIPTAPAANKGTTVTMSADGSRTETVTASTAEAHSSTMRSVDFGIREKSGLDNGRTSVTETAADVNNTGTFVSVTKSGMPQSIGQLMRHDTKAHIETAAANKATTVTMSADGSRTETVTASAAEAGTSTVHREGFVEHNTRTSVSTQKSNISKAPKSSRFENMGLADINAESADKSADYGD